MLSRALIAFCLFSLVATTAAPAASILFVPLTSTTVAPGGSVTFEIYGTSVNDIGAFSLYLNSTGTGSQFQLTSYEINTSLFADIVPSPTLPQTLSTTSISEDLGSLSNDTPPLMADTPYLLSTATVTVGNGTPGGIYYVGNTTATVFTDSSFNESDFAPVSTLQINIASIPEPSTWGLLVTGGMGLAILARRRQPRA
jgi:hypothetical protein